MDREQGVCSKLAEIAVTNQHFQRRYYMKAKVKKLNEKVVAFLKYLGDVIAINGDVLWFAQEMCFTSQLTKTPELILYLKRHWKDRFCDDANDDALECVINAINMIFCREMKGEFWYSMAVQYIANTANIVSHDHFEQVLWMILQSKEAHFYHSLGEIEDDIVVPLESWLLEKFRKEFQKAPVESARQAAYKIIYQIAVKNFDNDYWNLKADWWFNQEQRAQQDVTKREKLAA